MAQSTTRRQWLKTSATGAAGLALGTIGSASASANGPSSRSDKNPIRVVVWDEQQPAQKEAYENFLGNQIAAHLKTQEGLAVQLVKLDDPEQGSRPPAPCGRDRQERRRCDWRLPRRAATHRG